MHNFKKAGIEVANNATEEISTVTKLLVQNASNTGLGISNLAQVAADRLHEHRGLKSKTTIETVNKKLYKTYAGIDYPQKPHHFNPKEEYHEALEKMRKIFEERWSTLEPSSINSLERYTQKSVLGTGSFGTVLLVKEKLGKNYFAAKMMYKDDLVRLKQVEHVHNEKNVLHAVQFPNVVYLIDSCKDNDYLYLVLPYINGGELFAYHRKVRKFNEKQARFYLVQVLLALEYLHYMFLIYRDLKPENILLDSKGYIKITDFGFTKRIDGRTTTLCGTPEYLAPEIIQLKPYNRCVDFWAFGILAFELVSGRSPFATHTNDPINMYSKICAADFRVPNYFSTGLKALIEGLLVVDPSKRLGNLNNGVQDIKDQEWFHATDWYAMLNQEINPPYIPTVSNVEDLTNVNLVEAKARYRSKNDRHPNLFSNF